MFTTGDKVQWIKTTNGRKSFSMTRHEGTVLQVSVGGDIAKVKTRAGRTYDLPVKLLVRVGQRTDLDTVVETIRANAK